jgi:hypothetical protein
VGAWSAHGLVCLFGFSGHSARAGQTLAKKIKAKIFAGIEAEHRVHSFHAQKSQEDTVPPFSCQAFSEQTDAVVVSFRRS